MVYAEGPTDGWDDARVGSTITPDDRLILFSTLNEARRWEVWNEDPRGNDAAYTLGYNVNSEGILLNEDVASCWMSWVPKSVKFGNTSWAAEAHDFAIGDLRVYDTNKHCYRCLVAHSTTDSSVFADDLTAGKWVLVPVLDILEPFVIAYMRGEYRERNSQTAEGQSQKDKALENANIEATREVNNRKPGIKPSASSVAATTSAIGSQHGTATLASGAVDGTVTFERAFSAAPSQVLLTVECPSTGGTLDGTATVLVGVTYARTTTGFKFVLSGPTGDANHKLHWHALR